MKNQSVSLNDDWIMHFYDGRLFSASEPSALNEIPNCLSVPCRVPNNVELILSEAGYLPKDLYLGTHILEAIPYETYEWWFEKTFDAPKDQDGRRQMLCFDGVDCYADYFLNDQKIGESHNSHLPISLDVTDCLQPQNNHLWVHIHSAILKENDTDFPMHTLYQPWNTSALSTMTRKPPHCYGWDIMPRAVSAGIWKDVSLTVQDECTFSSLYIITDHLEENQAIMRLLYDLHLPHRYVNENLTIKVQMTHGDQEFCHTEKMKFKAGNFSYTLPNPYLWWPYGYGEPNLYHTVVTLYADDQKIAEQTVTVGVRTVKLIRRDLRKEGENSFRFLINGKDIVCKGLNWVPLDVYHSRDKSRYAKVLPLAKEIGCNILRCWGGNVYEQKEFFDYCDQNGIMVWQDFVMACFIYPQTEAFVKEIEHEAACVIRRLRQHPSLILWCGDNECDILQLASENPLLPSANILTREVLPYAVRMHDIGRPYLESSPFVADEVLRTNNQDLMPEDHRWGPRDYFKSDYYQSAKADFISETGYHGCPSPASVKKFIEPDHLWPFDPTNDQWILHSTDMNGNPARIYLMETQIKQYFDIKAETLEDFSFASQISQAEADKYFIERIRIQQPKTGGIILWNLIDGWPEFSDSLVDYYLDKKLAFDVVKRSIAPFAFFCGETENITLPIYTANDTRTRQSGHLTVCDGETNEVLWETEYHIRAQSTVRIGQIPMNYSDKKLVLLRWDGGFNHYITGMIPYDFDRCKKWYDILRAQK